MDGPAPGMTTSRPLRKRDVRPADARHRPGHDGYGTLQEEPHFPEGLAAFHALWVCVAVFVIQGGGYTVYRVPSGTYAFGTS